MKDRIIESIWQAKESIASHAPGDFKKLAEYIKKEAAGIRQKGPTVNLKEKKRIIDIEIDVVVTNKKVKVA